VSEQTEVLPGGRSSSVQSGRFRGSSITSERSS